MNTVGTGKGLEHIAEVPHSLIRSRKCWVVTALGLLVLLVWGFPIIWYSSDRNQPIHWLAEQTNVVGWEFKPVPVAEAAERVLRADRLVNGRFKGPSSEVHVFSAKRYAANQNDIGLFVHTPDRCWTEGGWKIQAINPEFVEVAVRNSLVRFERRVFTAGSHCELVYFGGLIGGEPVPYRLDHNLSVGVRHALRTATDKTGTTLRAMDNRFWKRVWEAFATRTPLRGPQHFIRISTSLRECQLRNEDDVLQRFVAEWLTTADFKEEQNQWHQNSQPKLTLRTSP